MDERFQRSLPLLGRAGLKRLFSSHVAVFGIGGVGGQVCECLARSGVGELTLFDSDRVTVTNLNRQIIALESSLGEPKVLAMKKRLLDINPGIKINAVEVFYSPGNADSYPLSGYDCIADCIDSVDSKLELISRADAAGVPIISAMGAGNKLDPTRLRVADIYSTSVCPLARVVRSRLKRLGIKALKTVFSDEPPIIPWEELRDETGRRVPASCQFVPSAMGIIIAREIVTDIIS